MVFGVTSMKQGLIHHSTLHCQHLNFVLILLLWLKCRYFAAVLLWLASFYCSLFQVRSSKEVRSKRFFFNVYRPFPFLGNFLLYIDTCCSCTYPVLSSHVSSVLSSKHEFLFQTFVYPWGVLYENYPPNEKYYNFTSSTAPDLNPACSLNM